MTRMQVRQATIMSDDTAANTVPRSDSAAGRGTCQPRFEDVLAVIIGTPSLSPHVDDAAVA